MNTRPPSLLEARQLGRRHPNGQTWLLEDLSLELSAGDRLVVAGPSGAGKTLLLRALALLDPLDHGEVCWQGKAIHRDRVPAYRAQTVYLHQRPALAAETVEGALRQPFSLRVHQARAFDRQWIVDQLQALGRDAAFLDKRVRDLSGGEGQITALLRAMQLQPQVLLLDEPTAAMDPRTAQAAEQLLDRWIQQRPDQRARIWVSHDRQQAERVGNRRITIEAGRLVAHPPQPAERGA
jgi:putative ABC transport system ATP-binding protein